MILPDGLKDTHCALRVLTIAQADSAASVELVVKVLAKVLGGITATVAVGACDIATLAKKAPIIVRKMVTRMLQSFFHRLERRFLGLRYIEPIHLLHWRAASS